MRPTFISKTDIDRWQRNLENDPELPPYVLESKIIKEVCFAGLWLVEKLDKLKCPEDKIVELQIKSAKESYGKNPWDIHEANLKVYMATRKNNFNLN